MAFHAPKGDATEANATLTIFITYAVVSMAMAFAVELWPWFYRFVGLSLALVDIPMMVVARVIAVIATLDIHATALPASPLTSDASENGETAVENSAARRGHPRVIDSGQQVCSLEFTGDSDDVAHNTFGALDQPVRVTAPRVSAIGRCGRGGFARSSRATEDRVGWAREDRSRCR